MSHTIHTPVIQSFKNKHNIFTHYSDKRKNFRKISFVLPYLINTLPKKKRLKKINKLIKKVNKTFSAFGIYKPAICETKPYNNTTRITIRIKNEIIYIWKF